MQNLKLIALLLLCSALARADVVDELEPGHWAAISLNTLQSLDPCPSRDCSWSAQEGQAAVIDDWNGGAFATHYSERGALIVFGGGHGGYFGNEVYAFDLDTLKWERLSEPVANPVCDQATGELQDGSPCSSHTYDGVGYDPATNSFIRLGSVANHACGGCTSSRVHQFDLTSKTWRGDTTSTFPEYGQFSSSAYDETRGVHWVQGGYTSPFAKYDNKWVVYNSENFDIYKVSEIDPTRDLFVSLVREQGVYVKDLSNPNRASIKAETIGDVEAEYKYYPGFEWDGTQFVLWAGGASVYTLSSDWLWTEVKPADTNQVDPGPQNQNGTFSRWQYVPAVDAFVVVSGVDQPVYMYRLHDERPVVVPPAPLPDPPAEITVSIECVELLSTVTAVCAVIPPEAIPDPTPTSGNWLERSTAPGVVYANDFTNQSDWLDNVYEDSGCTERYAPGCRHNAWDFLVGNGSVRFDILPETGSSSTGSVVMNFSENSFSENESFWIQWRQRFDAYAIEHQYATVNNGGSWKQAIIAQADGDTPGVACSENEIVIQNVNEADYPSTYIECHVYDPLDTFLGYDDQGSGLYTAQNQMENCFSFPHDADTSGCVSYKPDQWMTFMVHVELGPYGTDNSSASNSQKTGFIDSTYELYVGYEGEPLELVHSQTGIVFPRGAHGKFWLTTYLTNKDPDEDHAPASIWYDEVIVSSTYIASPN